MPPNTLKLFFLSKTSFYFFHTHENSFSIIASFHKYSLMLFYHVFSNCKAFKDTVNKCLLLVNLKTRFLGAQQIQTHKFRHTQKTSSTKIFLCDLVIKLLFLFAIKKYFANNERKLMFLKTYCL